MISKKVWGTFLQINRKQEGIFTHIFLLSQANNFKKNPNLGETVTLNIQRVDPQTNYLKLEVVA